MSIVSGDNENKLSSKTTKKSGSKSKPKRPKKGKLRDKNKLRRTKVSQLPPPTLQIHMNFSTMTQRHTVLHPDVHHDLHHNLHTMNVNSDHEHDIKETFDDQKSVEISQNTKKSKGKSNKSNLPYFLRKNELDKKENKIQSVSSNAYQKRKYKELLKICSQTEWEYINKYLSIKYGKRENNDYSDILKDIEIDFENIMTKICIEMLLILHESWKGRMQIISTFVDQLCDPSISDDVYSLKMCKFLYPLGYQFTDSRSLAIQEMNKEINRLCITKPQQFVLFAPYIIQQTSITWPGV